MKVINLILFILPSLCYAQEVIDFATDKSWTIEQIEKEVERIEMEISDEVILGSIGCGDEGSFWMYYRDKVRVREGGLDFVDNYHSESYMDDVGNLIKYTMTSGPEYEISIYYSERKVLKFEEVGQRENLSEGAQERIKKLL